MFKIIRLVFCVLILAYISYLSYLLYHIDRNKKILKVDYVELSNIEYGIFNVDEWKTILSKLLVKKIDEFDVTPEKKDKLKQSITKFLTNIINEFETKYNEDKSKTFKGKIEKGIAKLTGTFAKMKEEVPFFTKQILDFIGNQRNKVAVKKFLTSKLENYMDATFSQIDYTEYKKIIVKYQQADQATTRQFIKQKINILEKQIDEYKIYLITITALFFLFILFLKNISKIEFIFFIVTCVALLSVGVSLPMIEIDARISKFSMELLGDNIHFEDQILYYKSKSILEVIHLMLTQGALDLQIVGVLVCLFSLIFPCAKMITSFFITLFPRLQNNKVVDFLVFKTGKWSMADVMVIAIFMSYIGFSGILTEQLGQIKGLYESLEILTTNNSKLQVGFFAFTAFVVLGLMTTYKLQKYILVSKQTLTP